MALKTTRYHALVMHSPVYTYVHAQQNHCVHCRHNTLYSLKFRKIFHSSHTKHGYGTHHMKEKRYKLKIKQFIKYLQKNTHKSIIQL